MPDVGSFEVVSYHNLIIVVVHPPFRVKQLAALSTAATNHRRQHSCLRDFAVLAYWLPATHSN